MVDAYNGHHRDLGPPAWNASLEAPRRVDRDELAIAADSLRAVRPNSLDRVDRASVTELQASLDAGEHSAMERAYANDPRDTATPQALVELLAQFDAETAVSPASSALLRGFLARARPRQSLKLPSGTPVAHKTGTGWGTFNDIGIVTLPTGRHLLLAILVSHAQSISLEAGDALVADIARAVYDDVTR